MSAGLKALFVEHRGDLLSAAYRRGVLERLQNSDAPPFSPYARAPGVQV